MVSISTHSQMTHIFLFPTHTSPQSCSSKLTFPLTQLRTTHAQCDSSRTGDHQTPPICASSRVPCLRESTLLHAAVLARDQGVILIPLFPNHHLPHHQVLLFPIPGLYQISSLLSTSISPYTQPRQPVLFSGPLQKHSLSSQFILHQVARDNCDHIDSPLAKTLHMASHYF